MERTKVSALRIIVYVFPMTSFMRPIFPSLNQSLLNLRVRTTPNRCEYNSLSESIPPLKVLWYSTNNFQAVTQIPSTYEIKTKKPSPIPLDSSWISSLLVKEKKMTLENDTLGCSQLTDYQSHLVTNIHWWVQGVLSSLVALCGIVFNIGSRNEIRILIYKYLYWK